MFNKKTDYALNKLDSAAIVYADAEGTIVRLTCEDFSILEEFLKWKAWSDANYHITEKADHVHADHTLSLDGLSEAAAATPSPGARGKCGEKIGIKITGPAALLVRLYPL